MLTRHLEVQPRAPAWFTLSLPPEIPITSEINKVLRPVPWRKQSWMNEMGGRESLLRATTCRAPAALLVSSVTDSQVT